MRLRRLKPHFDAKLESFGFMPTEHQNLSEYLALDYVSDGNFSGNIGIYFEDLTYPRLTFSLFVLKVREADNRLYSRKLRVIERAPLDRFEKDWSKLLDQANELYSQISDEDLDLSPP